MVTVETICPFCREIGGFEFTEDVEENRLFNFSARNEPVHLSCGECEGDIMEAMEDAHDYRDLVKVIDEMKRETGRVVGPWTRNLCTSA